jgi:hypothetical protein
MFLGFTGSALAQTEEHVRQEPDREVVLKNTPITFGGVVVDGKTKGPGGSTITGDYKPIFGNLINVRKSFTYELQRSVDNL